MNMYYFSHMWYDINIYTVYATLFCGQKNCIDTPTSQPQAVQPHIAPRFALSECESFVRNPKCWSTMPFPKIKGPTNVSQHSQIFTLFIFFSLGTLAKFNAMGFRWTALKHVLTQKLTWKYANWHLDRHLYQNVSWRLDWHILSELWEWVLRRGINEKRKRRKEGWKQRELS